MKANKRLNKLQQDRRKQKNRNRPDEYKPRQRTVYNYKCGQKSVKLTVEKLDVFKDPPQIGTALYYACAFCNKEFESPLEVCPDCNQPVVKLNLKKCSHCQAKNTPLRSNCWVCAKPFEPPVEGALPREKETRLFLTLNVDGVFYRNTDKYLSPRLKQLFDDLIASNFSRAPLESWAKERESEVESNKELIREKCKTLIRPTRESNTDFTLVVGVIAVIVIIILLSLLFNR